VRSESPGAIVVCAAICYREYQEVKVLENFMECIPVQDLKGEGLSDFFCLSAMDELDLHISNC